MKNAKKIFLLTFLQKWL